MSSKTGLLLVGLLISIFTEVHANETKFHVEGNRIVYDTVNVDDPELAEITWADVDELERLLSEPADIRIVELNSSGGDIGAATYMADLVIDYELDTNVNGECASACTLVFLGGERRSVNRGSWLGFHQSWWEPEYVEQYFLENKDDEGWSSPFEFASWLYGDTQAEVLKNMQYFVERGVDPLFAIRTMQATSDDMWYPRRKELVSAGVIVE